MSDNTKICPKCGCSIEGDTMSFGEALKLLKMGSKVARLGWQGRKACLSLKVKDENNLSYIELRTARGNAVPWTPTYEDLLADDWWPYYENNTVVEK